MSNPFNLMPQPVSIFDAAKYILKESHWTITQIELQELLYLSQMVHLGLHGSPLVSARFEARKYGPMNKALYDETIKYGAEVLISSNIPGNPRAIVETTHKEVLDFVVNKLSDRVASELYTLTHSKNGAWHKTFDPLYSNAHIPDRLMKEEFIEKMKQVQNKPEYADAETKV